MFSPPSLRFAYSALCLFIFLVLVCAGQTVQSIVWNVPNGNLSDLSQTFNEGEILQLSWNRWDSTEFVDTTRNLVDLWSDGFNFHFPQRLTSGINLTIPGGYQWNISIPAVNLIYSAKYVLRFKITSPTFNNSNGDLSSPGFLVLEAATTSSPSSTTIASSSTRGPNPISIDTSTATALQTTTPHPPSSDLSAGAAGGIAGGVIAGAVAALALGIYCVRRRKKQKMMGETQVVSTDTKNGYSTEPAELQSGLLVAELPGEVVRTELPSPLRGHEMAAV